MSDSEENYSGNWYVVETAKDFCIVKETDILFNETLSLGENVEIFWSKTCKLEGKIRFIHGKFEMFSLILFEVLG